MQPIAALPTSLTTPPPIELGAQIGLQAAQNPGFEAILASTTQLGTNPITSLQALIQEMEGPAVAGTTLPDSGKDLPDGDPGETPALIDPLPVVTLSPAAAVLAALPFPVVRIEQTAPLRSKLGATGLKAAPPLPAAVPQTDTISLTLAIPRTDQPLPPAPLRLQPHPVQSSPPQPAAAQKAGPALPEPKPTPAPATASAPALEIVTAPIPIQRDALRKAALVAVTLTPQVQPEPMSTKPAGLPMQARLGFVSSEPNPQSLPLPLVTMPHPAPDAPFTIPAAMQGPQDFAQLVDRLVTARENAQPHAATIALAHAEFGPVELRFSQDNNGLAVTMASADPDFTRAVQAAAPAVSVGGDAASQFRQAGQNNAQQMPPGGQSGSHSHHPQGEPRDRLINSRSGGTPPENPDDQQGIFA